MNQQESNVERLHFSKTNLSKELQQILIMTDAVSLKLDIVAYDMSDPLLVFAASLFVSLPSNIFFWSVSLLESRRLK